MILNTKLDHTLNKLFYLFDSSKASIYSPDGKVKFETRRNTSDKSVILETFRLKVYEDTHLKINDKDIVVDIGGNIGSFAVWAASKCSQGHVYVYEPYKPSFKQLQKNISLNNLTNVTTINQAVSSKDGFLDFYINETSPVHNSSYKSKFVDKKITVPKITLEKVLKDNKLSHINFLKIDTEGSEYDIILNSSKKTLLCIDKVFLEYHENNAVERNHHEISAKLKEAGLRVKVYAPILHKIWCGTGYIQAWRE